MRSRMLEFYEKYWTVDGRKPPPLPECEKVIWSIAEELECSPYLKVWRRKYGWTYIINPLVQEELDKQKRYE